MLGHVISRAMEAVSKAKAKVKGRYEGKHPALAAPYVQPTAPTENRDESYKKTQQGKPRPVSKSHAAIIAQLSDGIPMTRADLHSFTGISITSLCGRIAELIERGQVEVAGSRVDPGTRRNVTTYRLKEVR